MIKNFIYLNVLIFSKNIESVSFEHEDETTVFMSLEMKSRIEAANCLVPLGFFCQKGSS
jgi:hypothetical protein